MYHNIKFKDIKFGDLISWDSFGKSYTGIVVAHYGDYLIADTDKGEWSVSEDQITYIYQQKAK